ncbi:MAG: HAMP domain-containing sensor histidine kinase [Pseudomonadota bacterium]
MHAQEFIAKEGGSLIAGFSARMGEAIVRRRAEIEVRAARIEAELAIKARSEFLANMNHELRTPLNAIMGFASMLREGDSFGLGDEQRKEYVGYIIQSADLLLGHINTLLEVAALEAGSAKVDAAKVELGDILNDAIKRAGLQAEAASVDIKRRDSGDAVFACGDAQRVQQSIDHLLRAAIRACGEKGRILARACYDEKGWAEIAIRDDGDGLTRDEIQKSLDAFNEVHRGLDRSFSGPGVEYAVAKTFVEMQGGRFSIKSKKGDGTLVRIALPPVAAGADAASEVSANQTETSDYAC